MPATYTISIGGVSKELRPGWRISETANGRALLRCAVLSRNATYRPALDAEVLITENGVRIFGGHVNTPSEAGLGGKGVRAIETQISAVDFNALADRRYVIDGGFPAGTTLISALTSIVGMLAAYGVTLDAAQVTGPALPLLVHRLRSITSILDEISVITGYLWRIDYDKKLRMFLPGALSAPFTLTTASRLAEGDIAVEPSRTDYANRVYVEAGTGTSEVTVTMTGNGTQTVFPLTYRVFTHRGYITVAGVNETIGSPGPWTLDTTVIPHTMTRSTAPANLAAISMTYIAQFPYIAQANDVTEQATNGLWEAVYAAPDVFDALVATNLAQGYLNRTVVTTQTVTYQTRQLGLHPGQTQTITVSERNALGTYLITDVVTQHQSAGWVLRTITATGGMQYRGSRRDAFQRVFGGGAHAPGTGTTVLMTSGGGAAHGTGTAGTLAKWATTSTLGDSAFTESGGAFTSGATGAGFTIALSASTVTGTLADARLTTNVPLKDAGSNIFTGAMTIGGTVTTNTVTSPSTGGGGFSGLLQAIGGLLGGGTTPTNITLTPTGDLITDPIGKEILPNLNYDINIGMLSKKYLTLHAAELWVETLVAADVMATIGGRVVVGPTTTLVRDALVADTTIYVKHNQMSVNDIGLLESGGKVEFMRITVANGATVDGFSYTVTRNLDGTGANDWYAGDAILNTGVTGNGFIDLYSLRGVKSSSEIGPTIVGNVRQSSTYNDWSPRWAIGNLNGLYGYSATTYGTAFGDPAATNVTVDATNGFRIRNGTTNKFYADTAGNLSLVGDLAMGTAGVIRTSTATAYLTGTGYWLDYNAGTPRFRVGNPSNDRLAWDGTDLTLVSGSLTIDANGIVIPAPTEFADSSSYRFSHTHGGGGAFGLYGRETSSTTRQMDLANGAGSAAGKTITTIIRNDSSATTANIKLVATDTTASIELVAISGVSLRTYFAFDELTLTPTAPASGGAWHAYARADKFVLQHNNAGTVRYYYLDGTIGSGTWTHTTTAP
jgi:hypothetical protein